MKTVVLGKCDGKYWVAEVQEPLFIKVGRKYVPVDYSQADYNGAMAVAKQGLVNDGNCNCGGKSESINVGDDGSEASSS